MTLAYLPSPSQGVWQLGPFPIRAYALCIILGIMVAIWWTQKRWSARGGADDAVLDIAIWAVPFGIVGGRLYHVITDPEFYLHPRSATHPGALHLGRWPENLGGSRPGCGGSVDRLSPPRHPTG